MVVWPFILFQGRDPEDWLVNHEKIHLQQIRRDGVGRFYYRYVREYLTLRRLGLTHHEAYRGISYEQEAYRFQNDPDYTISKISETMEA